MPTGFEITNSTSATLLEATLNGDVHATERVYLIYYPLVYRWCCEFGLQPCDASDVAQITMLKAFEAIQSYSREKGRFRVWLWAIAKHVAIDQIRRSNRERVVSHEVFDLMTTPPKSATNSSLPRIIVEQALQVLAEQLTERNLAIVKATLCDGRPPADVAAEFSTTTGAVYTARSRALRILRAALKGIEF